MSAKHVVSFVISMLDRGEVRVSHKVKDAWIVNDWIKKAILLYFKLRSPKVMSNSGMIWYDKIPYKYKELIAGDDVDYDEINLDGVRMVPGAYVRHGAYLGHNVVVMPSFINIGAYVGEGTLIDTWASIGSCAQIGKNCHISGGSGIGGVLEPIQDNPVIIEDDCFIGARSEIAEGVIVEEGSVISMGVFIGKSTKIFDRKTGKITYGRVPSGSVVVPGTLPDSKGSAASVYCAVIVKKVDKLTKSKVGINELLRE